MVGSKPRDGRGKQTQVSKFQQEKIVVDCVKGLGNVKEYCTYIYSWCVKGFVPFVQTVEEKGLIELSGNGEIQMAQEVVVEML